MKERIKGVTLSYIYMATHIFVSFISVPIILKFVGEEEYGVYQIVGALISYVAIFETSISGGTLKYFSQAVAKKSQQDMKIVLSISRKINRYLSFALVLICVLFLTLFKFFYEESLLHSQMNESLIMIILLFLNLIFSLSNSIYLAAITSYEKFTFLRLILIVSKLIQPLMYSFFLKIFPYAVTIVVIQLCINLILCLLRYLYFKKHIRITIPRKISNPTLLRSMLFFSTSILLSSIADQIFWKTDQLILGSMFSPTIVAVYSIGSQIYYNYMLIGIQASTVFYPELSRLNQKSDGIQLMSNLFIKVGRISYYLLFSIVIGFMLFGKEFIHIWVGSNFEESYYIALIVMIPFTIDIVQHIGLNILQVINKYSFRAKIYLFSAILNILSTLVLSKYMGALGAALSTGITMLITSGFILNWYYYSIVKLDIIRFWKEIIFITIRLIPSVLVGFLINLIIDEFSLFNFILKLVLFLSFYLINCYLTMNDYEKKLIINLVGFVKR
ncbi:lipopolysaccharide biosynthesis protein [Facklamia sp. P12932]|uniref:lipopolysaccharide biosynthesis protein n=1 Tax=Facklamia sp. P12932 TaxID=3421947 RepID=UPI003D17E772